MRVDDPALKSSGTDGRAAGVGIIAGQVRRPGPVLNDPACAADISCNSRGCSSAANSSVPCIPIVKVVTSRIPPLCSWTVLPMTVLPIVRLSAVAAICPFGQRDLRRRTIVDNGILRTIGHP